MRDWQIITLERLSKNFFGESLYQSLYRIPEHEERLRFLVQQVERMTGFQNFGVYMNKLLTIDAIFLNEVFVFEGVEKLSKKEEIYLCLLFCSINQSFKPVWHNG